MHISINIEASKANCVKSAVNLSIVAKEKAVKQQVVFIFPLLLVCGGTSRAQSASLDRGSHMLHDRLFLAHVCSVCGECYITSVVNLSLKLAAV